MADDEKLTTVAQLVGRNMRRVRESRGKVLLDVANAARDVGVGWDASAVSRIETGRRELTLDEFVALPLVMTVAMNENVTMVDLLDVGDETVILGNFNESVVSLDVLAGLAEPWLARINVHPRKLATTFIDDTRDWAHEYLNRDKKKVQTKREPPEDDPHSYEFFQGLASELGVSGSELWDAMQALWDYSTISGERERRLIESGEDLSNPTRVRTLRGHITRQLKAELRDYFATKKGADDGEHRQAAER